MPRGNLSRTLIPTLFRGPAAALGQQLQLAPGAPSTIGELLMGAPRQAAERLAQQQIPQGAMGGTPPADLGLTGQPKRSFFQKPGGKALGSILGTLAMGLLGAGIGAMSGGGRGARQGAAYGAGMGLLRDLGMRQAAAEAPAMQQQLAAQQRAALPGMYQNYLLMAQDPAYRAFYEKQTRKAKGAPKKSAEEMLKELLGGEKQRDFTQAPDPFDFVGETTAETADPGADPFGGYGLGKKKG